MSDIDVKKYLDQLKAVLPPVQPISTGRLKALHAAQDYKGMVQLMKQVMNIEGVTFVVYWVPEGAAQQSHMKDAPAWVELPSLPARLPFYGTKEFNESSLKMYFRKSFLADHTYDQVAILIAHELSHVILDSIWHPLHREEKAVDLTAMLLGFRLLYVSGAHKEYRTRNSTKTEIIGYLSSAEVRIANRLIESTGADGVTPSGVSGYARLKTILSSSYSMVGSLLCVVAVSAIWLIAFQRPKPLKLAPVPIHLQSPRLKMPTEQLRPGEAKATIPKDLMDRLK
jgi:hypothetical protein